MNWIQTLVTTKTFRWMRSTVGLGGISFCCKGHAALFLIIKKMTIYFMARFVSIKEFVGREIMRRESKLLLQRIMCNLNGCPSARIFSQYPNARWCSWEPRMKMSLRGQETLSWKAMKDIRTETSQQLMSLCMSELLMKDYGKKDPRES